MWKEHPQRLLSQPESRTMATTPQLGDGAPELQPEPASDLLSDCRQMSSTRKP